MAKYPSTLMIDTDEQSNLAVYEFVKGVKRLYAVHQGMTLNDIISHYAESGYVYSKQGEWDFLNRDNRNEDDWQALGRGEISLDEWKRRAIDEYNREDDEQET